MSAERLEDGVAWDRDGGRAVVFSGHESFACRYGWLPKLYEEVERDPQVFSNDDRAILALGLGRNMVKALRFWGGVFGLIVVERGIASNTNFAHRLFDPQTGLDRYLEDVSSIWRLHWNVTIHGGLGAWVTAFLEMQDVEVSKERLVELVRNRAMTARGAISSGTAAAHVDMLIRSYDFGRVKAATTGDESLGCPLQELHLLETQTANGAVAVRLPRGQKPELDVRAFAYALRDFWNGVAPNSRSISMRSLLLDRRSPGAAFRLDEMSLHRKLEEFAAAASGLELREDGAGGLELVARGSDHLKEVGRLAWLAH